MSPSKIHSLPSPAALDSYNISQNGFLPAETPLSRLSHDYYQPWENLISQVSLLVERQQIRAVIDELPVLDSSHLESEAEWQRAYSLLAVLAQGYIWAGPEPSERLPPQITIPFLQTSEHLEVHPIATYAALNLWNWRPLNECSGRAIDLTEPSNLVALHTATGTDDESWFLIISNAMEARAGPLIHSMLAAMEAVERKDNAAIVESLTYFKQSMIDIGKLLERMDDRCKPQVFYHHIRPFLAGSMNMETAGLPNGVFYDEGDGKGSWKKYRGGSNGQSSLLQFFDAVLSVNHDKCGGFHEEMRRYMPGPHARFLDDIESIANIRSYVAGLDESRENSELVRAFNEGIASLSEFRNIHIALVTRFIIIPSRQPKPESLIIRRDIASTSSKLASAEPMTKELVGTGGTKLIPFLRTSRDETKDAAVAR
ncbi:Putative indoleamine 2,3-dioxygenase [Septoria linicola]|uniref:Indoleamine 2,3-dioxygenase n=1 Tax=Septoria linicola TaxID=215465 RepID=A0A9Q9AKX9_9PEZI|nr:putative indoleamine 2,3-dioxygenase [Septoria linicola]USW51307.1 Putative indoleamine 2,3-dioxygenase [Septoria linicola]